MENHGHHTIDRLEERGVGKGSSRRSNIQRTREKAIVNQTNIWNCFKINIGKTSERRRGAHMGFPERLDTNLH